MDCHPFKLGLSCWGFFVVEIFRLFCAVGKQATEEEEKTDAWIVYLIYCVFPRAQKAFSGFADQHMVASFTDAHTHTQILAQTRETYTLHRC